ncbi:hypothetical protein JYT22_00830 [Endomicrobium sp. AH-315-J14]|nr:hypothetical protein [Endomicrobium sp. AH-315-J14]
MIEMPEPGLYRTTKAYPGKESDIPAGVLVYVGAATNGGLPFIVRPGANRKNRWFFAEPTIPFRAVSFAENLVRLPPEGFYSLPQEIVFDGGGKWLANAVVQLGYNGEGRGILFIAETHEGNDDNVLYFSDQGRVIEDSLLNKLRWAPILPRSEEDVKQEQEARAETAAQAEA